MFLSAMLPLRHTDSRAVPAVGREGGREGTLHWGRKFLSQARNHLLSSMGGVQLESSEFCRSCFLENICLSQGHGFQYVCIY